MKTTYIDYTGIGAAPGFIVSTYENGSLIFQSFGFDTAKEARQFVGHKCKWTERALNRLNP